MITPQSQNNRRQSNHTYLSQQQLNSQKKDKVYNIKGLAWMFKSVNATLTPSSSNNNSSHINTQFKIFKMKEEKKKWKKKTNKKFQGVQMQIQTVLRNKYFKKEPFEFQQQIRQPQIKYIPHLKQIKTFLLDDKENQLPKNYCEKQTIKIKENPSYQYSKLSRDMSSKRKTHHYRTMSYKKLNYSKSLDDQAQHTDDSERKDFSQNNNFRKKNIKTLTPSYIKQNNPPNKQILRYKKDLIILKNENMKIKKTKKLLEIHQQQQKYLQKYNDTFFRRQYEWLNNKISQYNSFNIHKYEETIINAKTK